MTHSASRALITAAVCTTVALGHYTWIAPLAPLEVGKSATIQIGHGHKFPQSEEAINAKQVDAFVLPPSGAKTKLQPVASGAGITATCEVKEAGMYRIAFIQDRGVNSRTPSGVKPGGRDKNPNAIRASRTLRTAVAYATTGKSEASGGKPLGLEFEISAMPSTGAWNLLLLKQGKPAAGVPIEVFLAGAPKAVEAGTTGADGRLTFNPAAGAKGPAMFSAALKDAAPAGAAFDFVNYETSLYVSW
jgi:hypothetical protein